NDLHRDVEVAHHPLDDLELLVVLLAEDGDVRSRLQQQLGDDGGHAREVAGPGGAVERFADAGHAYGRGKSRRVHDVHARSVEQVAAGAGEQGGVAGFVARIAGEVL